MKNYLLIALLLMLTFGAAFAQDDSTSVVEDTNTYRIIKTDGQELIGTILRSDAREVFFRTSDGREIYVPQHVIKEIVLVDEDEYNAAGKYVGEDRFATRYFLTTNGLPIKKGEHYVQWNLFGPDFQFGLGNNFGIGIMSSWMGTPLLGTIKKSWELNEKTQFAVGGILGTGSWAAPDWGGALPFATVSFGDRRSNIAFSGGYGAVWFGNGADGRAITSVAGMVKVAPNVSLVFDSFILLPGQTEITTQTYQEWQYNPNTGQSEAVNVTYEIREEKPLFAIITPGVRWHIDEKRAFQFGFSGIVQDDDLLPFPIPMIQWYRSLK